MGTLNMYTEFELVNLNSKTLRKPRRRWEDNIMLNLKETEYDCGGRTILCLILKKRNMTVVGGQYYA
jgi:hypothetical protein